MRKCGPSAARRRGSEAPVRGCSSACCAPPASQSRLHALISRTQPTQFYDQAGQSRLRGAQSSMLACAAAGMSPAARPAGQPYCFRCARLRPGQVARRLQPSRRPSCIGAIFGKLWLLTGRALVPMHRDLRLAGQLPPLDAPHHMRADEWRPFREGVVVASAPGAGSRLDVGLDLVRPRPSRGSARAALHWTCSCESDKVRALTRASSLAPTLLHGRMSVWTRRRQAPAFCHARLACVGARPACGLRRGRGRRLSAPGQPPRTAIGTAVAGPAAAGREAGRGRGAQAAHTAEALRPGA